MKKYYLEVFDEAPNKSYQLLFDLTSPRLTTEWGLEFLVVAKSDKVTNMFGSECIDDGYLPLDGVEDIREDCKLLEFESDEEAKLWFEMNYKV